MRRYFVGLAVLFVVSLVAFVPVGAVMAQAGTTVVTGVLIEVNGSAGALSSFSLSDGDGNVQTVAVNAATVLELEGASGDAWQATVGEAGAEAVARLSDQRERFAPVRVQIASGVAVRVDEANSRNLSQNLVYILAAFIITWVVLFVYVILVAQRQRKLQRDLRNLNEVLGRDGV